MNKQAANDVDIYWQKNTLADTEFCIKWVKGTLQPATSHLNEFILFCDNLQGQLSDLFKSEVNKLGDIVWYGVPNATDIGNLYILGLANS